MRRPALALVRTPAFPRGLEAFTGGACARGRGAAAPRGEGLRRRSHDSAVDRRARSGCTQRSAGRGPVARPERCVAPVVCAGVPWNRDALGCFWSLEGLARLAHLSGQPERAAQILAGVREQRDQIGAAWSSQETQEFEALGASSPPQRALTLPELVAYALEPSPGLARAVEAPPVAPPKQASGTRPSALRALGALQISQPAGPLVWASAKPRELLLFLLCHPDGRTREQVGLAFWPEASIEQVRNSFHVTLHRLRKTLGGAHWVTLSSDQYAVDSRVVVDFDA